MTDDAHPDRPRRPVRVARFDLAGDPEAGTPTDEPALDERTTSEPATDEPATGEPAAGELGSRVARLDGLDPASAGRAPVASLDGLDAPADARPLAPVIRLDSIDSRRAAGTARAPADSTQPRTTGSALDGGAPARSRRRMAAPPRDVRAAGADVARDESVAGLPPDGLPPDGLPPDGPLPRGRRKRARAGRLGPDAPDPELPLAEADPVAIAREICLRLLTDRARTRQELAQALARKGVPDEAAAAVLDRFAEVGLIDDAAFAGQWVRSRHTHRGLGRRAIAVELRRKGVADGVAKEALAEVDPESEDRRARDLVDRKLRSMVVDTSEQRAKAAQRLVGMLARKGYGAGTAYRVVREALAEHGADADELGHGSDVDG